jgi:hypothetical protein
MKHVSFPIPGVMLVIPSSDYDDVSVGSAWDQNTDRIDYLRHGDIVLVIVGELSSDMWPRPVDKWRCPLLVYHSRLQCVCWVELDQVAYIKC